MIAVKREVAARIERVFRGANVKLENWRQVTVQVKDRSASMAETVWDGHEQDKYWISALWTHTGMCTVTTCRASI